MTRDETKTLIRTMMGIWPTLKPLNITDTIDLWTDLLSDLDAKETMMALRGIAQTDLSGFAPSPGQLRKAVEEARKVKQWTVIKAQLMDATYGRLLP